MLEFITKDKVMYTDNVENTKQGQRYLKEHTFYVDKKCYQDILAVMLYQKKNIDKDIADARRNMSGYDDYYNDVMNKFKDGNEKQLQELLTYSSLDSIKGNINQYYNYNLVVERKRRQQELTKDYNLDTTIISADKLSNDISNFYQTIITTGNKRKIKQYEESIKIMDKVRVYKKQLVNCYVTFKA